MTILEQFLTINEHIKGLGTFDIERMEADDNSISLCIPFKKIECEQINQYIKNSNKLFKNEHPKSNRAYSETSLVVHHDTFETNFNLIIAIIDDVLEEMEIYNISLNNESILSKHTKNLFKKMILKQLDKVLSF